MFRNKQSEDFKKVSIQFDQIRMYLTNIAMLSVFLQYVGFIATKTAHYDKSADFIETLPESDPRKQIGNLIIPTIKWIIIGMTVGRVVLMALSYKYLWLTKTFFTYQLIDYEA